MSYTWDVLLHRNCMAWIYSCCEYLCINRKADFHDWLWEYRMTALIAISVFNKKYYTQHNTLYFLYRLSTDISRHCEGHTLFPPRFKNNPRWIAAQNHPRYWNQTDGHFLPSLRPKCCSLDRDHPKLVLEEIPTKRQIVEGETSHKKVLP